MAARIVTEDLIIAGQQKNRERRYWLGQLAGELADSRFPSDRVAGLEGEGGLASIPFDFDEELSNRLGEISNHSDLRLFMVLTAGLTLLLNKYTGLEDVLVGAPVNRQQEEADFINTVLILRQKVQDEMSFKQLLMQVRDTTSAAIQHQNFPLITLKDQLNEELPEGRSFPFRTAIVLEELQDIDYLEPAAPEMIFSFRRENGRFIGTIHYRTERFLPGTVARLGGHYLSLLAQAVKHADIPHVELDWIPSGEQEELLHFNDTVADYPHECTLVQLFDQQAANTPDRLAVVAEGSSLTYAEVKQQADRVATALRHKGIGSGHILGLLPERNSKTIVALLGIMKAGAAYLPISPHWPANRVQEVLEDCDSPLLITPEVYRQLLTVEAEELPPVSHPNDLAYVIYTSGSTGKPKGTMIEHKSVVNFTWGMWREIYSLYEAPFRAALVSPFEFDASIQLIFGTLLFGHTLYIVPEEARLNGGLLLDFFRYHQIEVTDGTPTHLRHMMDHLQYGEDLALCHLIIAGETLPPLLAKGFLERFGAKKPQLTNAYGPTEATVNASSYHISYEKLATMQRVPIGSPLLNSKVLILGPRNQLQPIGVPGELCITGNGLARGYLHRPESNLEKFQVNPFAASTAMVDEGRMYRTGDLARWLPDGNLDYLGRIDDQVKIRGMRIELGEIESRLRALPSVRDTVVTLRKTAENEDAHLCAYVVLEIPVDVADIRRSLAEDLPYYMVPTYLIPMDKFPVTPNGKIDRKALPAPERLQSSSTFEAPRNDVERALADIWCRVLGVEEISIHDSFFERGGNSLQITTIASHIKRDLGVDIPLREAFIKPTILDLAAYVQSAEQKDYTGLQRQEEREDYPVSSAQKRLYVLNRFEGIGTAYNIPGVLKVDGPFAAERLTVAVQSLVERHESLRTSFQFKNGQPVQIVGEPVPFQVERFEGFDTQEIPALIQAFIRPFDLTKAPLFRVGLISISGQPNLHYVLFDLHHIIADGVSLALLEQEFIRLYMGESLETLDLQYKDYAVWQREQVQSEEMREQERFWINQFSDEVPVLELPTDYPRSLNKHFAGDRLQFDLPADLTEQLKSFAEQQGVTLYMLLLAAYNVLLHRYTKQEDIIVGTPIAGRLHSDQESMVGMFVNTLALRNRPTGDKTFSQLLDEVKQHAIEAYQHQEYPFEELVDRLQLERNSSRNPLFDTMLFMQNYTRQPGVAKGLTFTPYPFTHHAAKFDITLEFHQEADGMLLAVEYATKLYKRETMERFSQHYLRILEDVIQKPHQALQDVSLLDEEETQNLLTTFNQTASDWQETGLIHQLLEKQAEEYPARDALISEEGILTYGELNARANQLARHLRECQVGPEDRVGLLLSRSQEMVIAIYAVLKAGGTYVPIDPEFPTDRIQYLLRDSGASMLLTQRDWREKVDFSGSILDVTDKEIYQGDPSNLPSVTASEHLAYILYTSGSTGQPKGVMVEHRNIINFLHAMQQEYPMMASDTFLLKTPYTFDVSVPELFGWTIMGGRLAILKEGDHRHPKAILRAVTEYNVGLLNFVPSMFGAFLNALGGNGQPLKLLKYLLLSGETVTKDLVERFHRLGTDVQLDNLYGPTEATVFTTRYPLTNLQESVHVPIGRPIANVQGYILDGQEKPVPIGVVGELFIAGAGLARGYLNQHELTTKKFRPHPFIEGERMYHTGDLARWLPDGNIEFLGRIDHQVKVNGFRIELGEIETLLYQLDGIIEAVVVDQVDSLGNKQLVAYYVADRLIEPTHIKTHVSRFLPNFMVPAFFHPLTEMARTSSGKIDRNSLVSIPIGVQKEAVSLAKPRTELERKLVQFWKQLFKRDEVSIDDDFFELGGNSLAAVELDLALEENGAIDEAELLVYEHRTIRLLAEHLESYRVQEDRGGD
ncbi:amino acid adenylation domain-containing protein [Marininema mesophilum]|uniref:Amino acid adenylation domain-containing protein n=1 Tax=Marininema mesophilum TaxID=1048340 RepID=A0A1H2Q9W2_9BACL|nr:non-ribosomal peptide synthetase [Marininema mesophilum]SDW03720.1 amino acid adenylation domain-containing protein [Marininema mesophilum]